MLSPTQAFLTAHFNGNGVPIKHRFTSLTDHEKDGEHCDDTDLTDTDKKGSLVKYLEKGKKEGMYDLNDDVNTEPLVDRFVYRDPDYKGSRDDEKISALQSEVLWKSSANGSSVAISNDYIEKSFMEAMRTGSIT